MGMTMTQKLLARAGGLQTVRAGQFLECELDLVMGNDITAPVAIDEFYKMGCFEVFDSAKVVLVPDHFTPNKDIASAGLAKQMREFAKAQSLTHYYEVGRAGIEHVILPEKGLVLPGDVVIGADSHTCTYGALGAFSTGVGSTDMAAAMATGKCWFKTPEAMKITFTGKKRKWVTGKDIILYIIGLLGVDGARYMSIEFAGVSELTMDDRFTMANMVIEAGAKNGIFPVDIATLEYTNGRGTAVEADEDAEYAKELTINLGDVPLTVAYPHLPANAKSVEVAERERITIDQAVIGSCTNGRMDDMRAAAEILRGKKLHEDVRAIIIPGSQKIYKQCMEEGLAEIFIDAGAVFSTPTCGPCLGGYMGILADGERCISTTNRNFVGRMGHKGSLVYLASPAVAAASAVAGYIVSPETVTGGVQ